MTSPTVFGIFQSTLLQEERRKIMSETVTQVNISIHAPTRGATTKQDKRWRVSEISIHAPTRGATTSSRLRYIHSSNFNPRSYKRSDRGNLATCRVLHNFNPRSYKRSDSRGHHRTHATHISIHAPTRGATSIAVPIFESIFNFNPRSYKRSDLEIDKYAMQVAVFQSTLLQEERLNLVTTIQV